TSARSCSSGRVRPSALRASRSNRRGRPRSCRGNRSPPRRPPTQSRRPPRVLTRTRAPKEVLSPPWVGTPSRRPRLSTLPREPARVCNGGAPVVELSVSGGRGQAVGAARSDGSGEALDARLDLVRRREAVGKPHRVRRPTEIGSRHRGDALGSV